MTKGVGSVKNHNLRLVSPNGCCLWPRDKGATVP